MGTLAQFCPLLQTPVHASGTRHSRRTLSRRGSGRRSRRVTFCAAFLVTLAVPTPTLARGPEDVSRSPHVPSGHGAAHRDTIDGEHTPESTGRTWMAGRAARREVPNHKALVRPPPLPVSSRPPRVLRHRSKRRRGNLPRVVQWRVTPTELGRKVLMADRSYGCGNDGG
jgi:hypothetical protein